MAAEVARRPLKTREKQWPRRLAFLLVRIGLTPNQVSLASATISALGALSLAAAARGNGGIGAALFLGAAVCVQARLLCNLLDGLMAVEGGLKTSGGEIFNEFPDRFADVILLVAAGYSIRFGCSGGSSSALPARSFPFSRPTCESLAALRS